MTTRFKFYIVNNTVVEASITDRPDGVLVGEVECSAELLYPIMQLAQNAVELVGSTLIDNLITYQPDPENNEAWEEGLEELNRRLCHCDETHQQHLDTCPLSKSKTWN